ncbi:uncharacterized protein LOC143567671 isoform X1 [Bidens hawaiensis]|uniref:uncharacterized protein LOC143567671 isoform X1 n=1 Tax=Bidens hawaiensis TaxID=980011 RepID=UPI00404B1E3B
MRFKTGRRVEITNKEAPASLRKISRNNKVEPSFCLKIHQNDARVRKPKRASPFGSLHPKSKKVKLAENDCGQSQRHSFKKVDAFEGKTYTQASFNYTLNGYYEMEKNESDNDQCSVGSCSVVSDGYNKLTSQYDVDVMSSDGESYNNTNTSWVEHEVAESVHRLELHAYRSTLEALYASGPLSWEKEAVLTNLRINLHISNDEHLTELKHLISSGARFLD